MISPKAHLHTSGFTLVETLVAMAVFSIFAAALMATFVALETSAMNTSSYAQRQNDQMRVFDYLRRDIRRSTSVDVYSGATIVADGTFGSELRLVVPDYYTDAREDDNTSGPNVPNAPAMSGTTVTYGTPITVRYYASSGAVIRNEAGTERKVADAVGAFTVSFCKETGSNEIRSRVFFDQRMRSGGNRTLRRQVDILCGQRAQLQL